MMLTNYPINRALVAERQRERLGYAERTRRIRGTRGGSPTLPSTTRWRFTSWLLGRSLQSRGTRKPATTAPSTVAPTTCP